MLTYMYHYICARFYMYHHICACFYILLHGLLQNEQKDTIRNFREGVLNLLISTNVAEEGLDIPECNLVVRYGLMTNEVAQQQAIGRARASDSVYSVVAQAGGREVRRELTNEYLEELTGKAISEVQKMDLREFSTKVRLPSCTALSLVLIVQGFKDLVCHVG